MALLLRRCILCAPSMLLLPTQLSQLGHHLSTSAVTSHLIQSTGRRSVNSLLSNTTTGGCQYLQQRGAKSSAKSKQSKSSKPKVLMSPDEMADVIDYDSFRNDADAIEAEFVDYLTNSVTLRGGIGIDELTVTLEGEKLAIKELAVMSIKNDLIVLNCGEFAEAVKPIYGAIVSSDLNLVPQIQNNTVYIPLPKVTKTYRENLVKNARNSLANVKLALQKLKNKHIEKATDPKDGVSEDTVRDVVDNIRYQADLIFAKCEKMLETKIKSLLNEE